MSAADEKEWSELERKYPVGSSERMALEFSRGTHEQPPVPPMLSNTFKLLMGISALMAAVSLAAVFLVEH